MCGIVGIISHRPVAGELYESLIHLQHRGQDAAGIMTCDPHRFYIKKGKGFVRDIFDQSNMSRLVGNLGIGHSRYPTSGGYGMDETQPLWTSVPFGIAMSHNGNLINYSDLRKELEKNHRRYLNSSSDTEGILHLFGSFLHEHPDTDRSEEFFEQICTALEQVFRIAIGSFSVVTAIIGKGLIAFRDPHGIRPLVQGIRPYPDGSADFIFASESSMFSLLGFEQSDDVQPGEVVYICEGGKRYSKVLSRGKFSPCVFEYVYFARPDALLNDVSVYRARLRMGQNLAKTWNREHPELKPDIVIPVPSTSNTAALSLAHELGVRYSEGLYKNPFIGRTFIMPGQEIRRKAVRYKLVPQETEIRGKIVMLVDDSIVRGTTCKEIIKMVREFGAQTVYFVTTAPPMISPCFYGIDFPSKSELIASNRSIEEIRLHIGADVLLYQSQEDLVEAVTRKGDHEIESPCMACMNGRYVTGGLSEQLMFDLERQRNNHRRN